MRRIGIAALIGVTCLAMGVVLLVLAPGLLLYTLAFGEPEFGGPAT